VWRGDTGAQITADPSIHLDEGALVLDSDSRLIGMCTMAADGVHMVEAGSILAAINDAIASEAPVWLGVTVGADADGNLTILAVDADGPSALAGVQAGSVIRAIDGVAVTTYDALRSGLLAHKPGETAMLSIVPPGATGPVDVTVTLTPNPGAL
jgi:S1-C subfamily serine protease